MTFLHATPVLGILNDQDRACAEMLAIVVSGPSNLVWTYVKPRPEGNSWVQYESPESFTPLNYFLCKAWFTPTGMLALTCLSLVITKARYSNGTLRPWQGPQQEMIAVHPDVVRYVHEVLAAEAQAKSDARRVKA